MRIVCIGAGYFAKFHIEAWLRIPEVELIAICDQDISKAKALANEFGVEKTYCNLDEAIECESFEIVDVITPPATHLELCQLAAKNGKHVICQKPLAPTFEEAKTITQIINKSNVRFMVHENFRFQPWYRKIKELINDQVIGDEIFGLSHRMRMGDGWPDEAYLARQPYFRKMPRLLIHETGIHFIDVFRFLLGDISSVFARLRKLNQHIAGEDAGVVFFDFKNGSHATLDANRYNEVEIDDPRYTFGEMLIDGNGGSIRLDLRGNIYTKKLGQPEIKVDYQHEHKNFAGDCVYFTQRHFVDCIVRNEPFETHADHYLENLEIQEAIYLSSEEKIEVEVKGKKKAKEISSTL